MISVECRFKALLPTLLSTTGGEDKTADEDKSHDADKSLDY